MAADAKLIEAITKAEYAKNVPDLSKHFEGSFGAAMSVMEGGVKAAGYFAEAKEKKNLKEEIELKEAKEKKEIEDDAIRNNLSKVFDDTVQVLGLKKEGYDEGSMPQKYVDGIYEVEDGIRVRLDELLQKPKSREREREINALMTESKQYVDGIVGLRGAWLTVSKKGDSSINYAASFAKDGGKGMKQLTKILDIKGDYKDVTPVYENGEIYMDVKYDRVMSRDELIEDGFDPEEADLMIKQGGNIIKETNRYTRKDLEGMVVRSDKKSQSAIMKATGDGSILSKDSKLQMEYGQSADPFDDDGVQASIRKNIRVTANDDGAENIYDMIYAKFEGEGSSYAESVANNPIIKTARYLGINVGNIYSEGPPDSNPRDGVVEVTNINGEYFDESGNKLDWDNLQEKLLKPETLSEKKAVADDIAFFHTQKSKQKYEDEVAQYKKMLEYKNDPNRNRKIPTISELKIRDVTRRIDELVRSENPSILEMNSIIGGGGERKQIRREGNEYVITESEGKTTSPLQRFNVNDKKALKTWLLNYSKGDEYYSGSDPAGYEYQEGDTIENPITVKPGDISDSGRPADFPVKKKNAIEGKYYKSKKTKQVYLFINGDFKPVGPPYSEGEESEGKELD